MKTRLYYLSNNLKNEVISLRRLKDMIRYKYLFFHFRRQLNEVVNIFSETSVSPHRIL